jgi:hypothetical protein
VGKAAATARQQHGKHISAAKNQQTTTEELLEAVFSVWSTLWHIILYSEDQQEKLSQL